MRRLLTPSPLLIILTYTFTLGKSSTSDLTHPDVFNIPQQRNHADGIASPLKINTDVIKNSNNSNKFHERIPYSEKDDKGLRELLLTIDRHRQMHRLASSYLGARQFLLLYLPSIFTTMIAGVLSFLLSGKDENKEDTSVSFSVANVFDPNAPMKIMMSKFVGILSVFSVFLQSVNKELDWSHRSKQHEYLSIDLRTLDENLNFDILRFTSSKARDEAFEDIIFRYQKQYIQASKTCKSPIPPQISNAFELILSRLQFSLAPVIQRSLNESGGGNALDRIDWTNLMVFVNNELYNQFCRAPLWPYWMPSGEKMVERALEKVHKIYLKKGENSDHESP